jgi:hypothetical protein
VGNIRNGGVEVLKNSWPDVHALETMLAKMEATLHLVYSICCRASIPNLSWVPLWELPSDPSKSELFLLLGSLSRFLLDSIVRVSTREAKILAVLDRADLLAEPVARGHLGRPGKFGQRFCDGPFHHMGFFPALPALGGFGRDPEGQWFLPTFGFPPFGCLLEFRQRLHPASLCHILVLGGSACSQSWLGLVDWFLLLLPGPVLGRLPPLPRSWSPLLDRSLPFLLGSGF